MIYDLVFSVGPVFTRDSAHFRKFLKNFFVCYTFVILCVIYSHHQQEQPQDDGEKNIESILSILRRKRIMTTLGVKTTNFLRAVTQNKKAMIALKVALVAFCALILTLSFANPAFAAETDINLDPAVHPVLNLINKLVNPLLLIVGAGGVIFCIILGVKYATAEEPQEREKRKQSLKTAIIGYLLIFILVVILRLSIGPLTKWMAGNSNTAQTSTSSTKTK